MKRKPILAGLLLMLFQVVQAQINSDQVTISLDNVAFEEGDYMSVLNSDNQIIAYYHRFENQSSPVKSVRVFDTEKNLKYVLVPIMSDEGFKIHIRDSNKRRGLLNLTASIKGLSIKYLSEVDYFGKPYSFRYSSKIGIGKIRVDETVQYRGEDVISNRTKVSALSGIDVPPLTVDKEFYEGNKLDAANWVLILELLKELALESSKYNDSGNVRQ